MEWHIGAVEARFADLIWDSAPVASGVLAKRSEEIFGWKKSTAYTVLKRLCDKGLFVNEGGTVKVLLSKEEFYRIRSVKFVDETFNGSLPAFLAAFTSNQQLSPEDVSKLRQIVDSYGEE